MASASGVGFGETYDKFCEYVRPLWETFNTKVVPEVKQFARDGIDFVGEAYKTLEEKLLENNITCPTSQDLIHFIANIYDKILRAAQWLFGYETTNNTEEVEPSENINPERETEDAKEPEEEAAQKEAEEAAKKAAEEEAARKAAEVAAIKENIDSDSINLKSNREKLKELLEKRQLRHEPPSAAEFAAYRDRYEETPAPEVIFEKNDQGGELPRSNSERLAAPTKNRPPVSPKKRPPSKDHRKKMSKLEVHPTENKHTDAPPSQESLHKSALEEALRKRRERSEKIET